MGKEARPTFAEQRSFRQRTESARRIAMSILASLPLRVHTTSNRASLRSKRLAQHSRSIRDTTQRTFKTISQFLPFQVHSKLTNMLRHLICPTFKQMNGF